MLFRTEQPELSKLLGCVIKWITQNRRKWMKMRAFGEDNKQHSVLKLSKNCLIWIFSGTKLIYRGHTAMYMYMKNELFESRFKSPIKQ